jgi:hypothetical protein
MNYEIYIIIGLLIVPLGIFFAYRKDYKQNPTDFKKSIKTVGAGLLAIFLFIGLKEGSKLIIPLKKNYGIEFNSERRSFGIPTIEKGWIKDKYESEQFATYWWKPEPRNGHFKKVIEFGLINAVSETDYYQNEKLKETFAWSKFYYHSKSFEYFLEKSNGGSKTIVEKIDKTEFEKYISE